MSAISREGIQSNDTLVVRINDNGMSTEGVLGSEVIEALSLGKRVVFLMVDSEPGYGPYRIVMRTIVDAEANSQDAWDLISEDGQTLTIKTNEVVGAAPPFDPSSELIGSCAVELASTSNPASVYTSTNWAQCAPAGTVQNVLMYQQTSVS